MARVEASPYAVSRICFPTLALSNVASTGSRNSLPSSEPPTLASGRRPASENHRDYLSSLHARKLAVIKRARAGRKVKSNSVEDSGASAGIVTMSSERAASCRPPLNRLIHSISWRSIDLDEEDHFSMRSSGTRQLRNSSTPGGSFERSSLSDSVDSNSSRRRPRIFVTPLEQAEGTVARWTMPLHRRVDSEEERIIEEGIRSFARQKSLCMGYRRELNVGRLLYAERAHYIWLMRERNLTQVSSLSKIRA